MNNLQSSKAGTLESNDALVYFEPKDKLEIQLESIVLKQYGVQINEVINKTLKKLDVTSGFLKVIDMGALNYTLEARITTAIKRARGE